MNERYIISATLCLVLLASPLPADEPSADEANHEDAIALRAARDEGLQWLTSHQNPDGSWGKTYPVAVTSFACLSYLSAADEPYTGEHGQSLVRGLQYLLDIQQDGMFPLQERTWIHGQGFGTLALSEAYGRSLLCEIKPDIDADQIHDAAAQAVQVIAENQLTSGGWWYTPGSPGSHEGSTTVCAVQALVSSRNYGIEIDEGVLTRGFAYLKQCQNEDGGFDYSLGDSVSMKEGTAAGVATLGLMKKFDFLVMVNGYRFLLDITPATISQERFPYYGHFYGCMGMQLLGEEFQQDETYRTTTSDYVTATHADLLSWQEEDGSWPARAWIQTNAKEGQPYATAFAALTLSIPEHRLSIYNRRPPELPEDAEDASD